MCSNISRKQDNYNINVSAGNYAVFMRDIIIPISHPGGVMFPSRDLFMTGLDFLRHHEDEVIVHLAN